ncbi:hypothetical protein ACQ5SP_08225 [Rhodovulum sp. YNF3179]|uniref:hypothetical protein n=1 Tax=Rhodovulum sp. YNF3179 TaxID=3425127 RepID=UPI003D34FF2E
MPLTKIIDLVAEVAAKRVAREREPEDEPSDTVWLNLRITFTQAMIFSGLPACSLP